MNEWTFAFGMVAGIITGVGLSEYGWPLWVPAATFAVLLTASWLGRDYLDARRCRKQRRIEMEGSKEAS